MFLTSQKAETAIGLFLLLHESGGIAGYLANLYALPISDAAVQAARS
jgi:hypothetical protein